MKSEKSVLNNYLFNTLYTILNILYPLITIPYLSRILMAEGMGQISFAQSIVAYFLIFAQLGIPRYGVREIAKVRDSSDGLNSVFSSIFTINAISTIICLVVYFFTILYTPFFNDNKVLMMIFGSNLLLNIFNVDWFYSGLEEYKYITLRSLIVKLVSLIMIFLFVRSKSDLISYALIYCFAIGGNYIFNAINLKNYVNIDIKNIEIRKHLKPIIILFATAIAVGIYAQLDTSMLGFLSGIKYVGYYTNPMRLVTLVVNIVTSLSVVLLPRLSYYYDKGNILFFHNMIEKAYKVTLVLGILSFLGTFFLADPIVSILFGNSFLPSNTTLKLLSFLILPLSIGNLFGTQVLIIVNRERELMYTVFAGAITNVILNSILIQNYYQNGAAVASVIAEIIVMILQYYFAKKFLPKLLDIKFFSSLICASILTGLILKYVTIAWRDDLPHLLLSTLIGITSYFGLLFILKNEVTQLIWNKIQHRLQVSKIND